MRAPRACVVRASFVRHACVVRASCVRRARACVVRASCVRRACVVHAPCVRRACAVRASCVRRACVVRASRVPSCGLRMRAWELMRTYGNFMLGNLWELMGTLCVGSYGNLWELTGTYGNLWELMGTYGNLWELMGTSCAASSCVGTYGNSERDCKAFLHCGFALCDVFTLRCYDAKRFHTADLFCVTFSRCICSHFMNQCINFLSQSICFHNHIVRVFVDPQRVCHHVKI